MYIEIKWCQDCPLQYEDSYTGSIYCNHPDAKGWDRINDKWPLPDNCPLKTSPITIKIEEK